MKHEQNDWHFEKQFFQSELYFDSNVTEFCSKGPTDYM